MTNPSIAIKLSLNGAETAGRQAQAVGRDIAEIGKAAEQASGGGDKLANAIQRIGQYGSGLILGAGVLDLGRQIAAAADAYTNLESRLKIVTAGEQSLGAAMQQTFGIAQATRQSWEQTADLYGKLSRATNDLGLSQQQLGGIVTTVNQAVLVSGGSAQSAQAALVQLGQAFSSGTLRGEELNSILEQTPRLAQAIADGLGVSVGALRKMGEEGELSAAKVSQALQRAAQGVSADFAQMAPTVSGAWQQMGNAALQWVGNSEAARGASQALAQGMSAMAQDFGTVARAAEATATAVGVLAGGALIASIAARVKHTAALIAEATAERAAAQAALQSAAMTATMVGATNELTAAKTRLIAAETALGAAQAGTLRGFLSASPAIAALGGPIGATVTGLIALGAAFWSLASSAEKAADKTKSTVADEAKSIVESLQKQIDKLKERNDLMGRGLPASDQMAELSGRVRTDNARLEAEKARLANQPTTRTGWFGEQLEIDDDRAERISAINQSIAENNRLLEEAARKENELAAAKKAAEGPSQAYLDLTFKLRGGNKDFQTSLQALYTEFLRLGGVANADNLKRYREEVALLVKSVSPAAKKADSEHEASIKRIGEMIAKNREGYDEQIASIRHQTNLIGKTAETQAILNAQRKIELDLARDLAAVDREKGLSSDEKTTRKATLTAGAAKAKDDVVPAIRDQFKAKGDEQAENELIARRALLAQRFQDIEQSLQSEQDLEAENHATRLGTLAAWHEEQSAFYAADKEKKAAVDAQYNALAEAEETRHQAAMGDVTAQGALKRRQFERMSMVDKLQDAAGFMSANLAYAANLNKGLFQMAKLAAITDITISGYKGAEKTWSTYPYPWNIPMTAAHVIGTVGRLAAVKGQQFGGGGSAPSMPSGGGTPSIPSSFSVPESATPPTRGEAAREKTVMNITWHGESGPDYKAFVDHWVPLINKASENGALEVNVTRG